MEVCLGISKLASRFFFFVAYLQLYRIYLFFKFLDLLCRIVDTVEDEVSLTIEQKEHFCSSFIEVVRTGEGADIFARDLAPLLSEQTIPAEHVLIQLTSRVIEITHSFAPEQISALLGCVETMAKGMPVYQGMDLHGGLETMQDMNEYCYYVAGCVGEIIF
jgi:farnesyl-diphosphate farnesyltransferase